MGVRFAGESTSATGRAVVAAAFGAVDPVGARSVEHETDWRHGYLTHFLRLTEAGLDDGAVALAQAGLAQAAQEFRYDDLTLAGAVRSGNDDFATQVVTGAGEPESELTLPYRGERLRGEALTAQLTDWVERGIVTRSCADAVAAVQAHPEWLRLAGDTVVVLGAGAEMGPYRQLLRWGATVAAVDLPRADVQDRIGELAQAGAGRVLLPVRDGATGADLLTDLPGLARWISALEDRLVLGTYCYADGGTHVLLSMAGDALATHLLDTCPGSALAYLATPTDAFAVPGEEVAMSVRRYEESSRAVRTPLRAVSGGRLFRRNYPPGADPGVCDALVPQQGPNYALAKRLQRWRATTARAAGNLVSLNVAPATRTRSVMKNRGLAAAYAGAHHFGVEVFDPGTSNALMAALLVHDLRAGTEPAALPWQDEAAGAAHGGLWTSAYRPRSVLGLAAVLGLGTRRP